MPDTSRFPDWPRAMAEELAAAYVGVSVGTFRAHVRPHVPSFPVSPGRRCYDRRQLDAWVDRQTGAASSSHLEDGSEWMAALDAAPAPAP